MSRSQVGMPWAEEEGRSSEVSQAVRARGSFTYKPTAWALSEPHKAPLPPTYYPASLSPWKVIGTRESRAFIVQREQHRREVLPWQHCCSEAGHFIQYHECLIVHHSFMYQQAFTEHIPVPPAVLGHGGKAVWVSALTQIPFSWGNRRGNGQLRWSIC